MQWTHFKKLKINKLVEHIIIVHLSKVWNQIVSLLLFQSEHPVSLTGLTAGPNIFHFTKSPTIVQASEIIEGKAVTGASYFEALQAMLRQFFQSFCILLGQAPTQVINGTVLRVVVPSACRVRTPLNTGICSLVAVWEIGSAQVSTFFRKSIEHDLGKTFNGWLRANLLGWPNCTSSSVQEAGWQKQLRRDGERLGPAWTEAHSKVHSFFDWARDWRWRPLKI